MRAAGIIVEYNPFHNGHKYHLEKTREISGANIVAAVMSSDFLQRGEPAVIDKWRRTETALKEGIDLVVELPVFYANQSAEIFALGAVSILGGLGVESIVFGSEAGDIEEIKGVMELQERYKNKIDERVREKLESGMSYPNAMSEAMFEVTGEKGVFEPNNILGIEYCRAIESLGIKAEPMTIKRYKAGYHSKEAAEGIASATAVRKFLFEKKYEEVKNVVPDSTYSILEEEEAEGRLMEISKYYNFLRFAIISNVDRLHLIQDMEPGLENRLYEAAVNNRDFYSFYENVKTKRHTNSRLMRILTHILTNITKEITAEAKQRTPPYIRVLGFNEKGRSYLNKIKKEIEIPLLTNLKGVEERVSEDVMKFIRLENYSVMIYNLINGNKERKEPIYFRQEGK